MRLLVHKAASFLLVLVAGFLCSCGGGEVESATKDYPVVIGLSMGGVRMERWKKDEQIIMDAAATLGASVVSYSANENAALQTEQAENLIIQGVDVLIVIPQDSEAAANIIPTAHEAGVPVIAYDRLINNCDLDYYVSFDNVKVGEYQAREVVARLDPSKLNSIAYVGGAENDNNSHLIKTGAMRVLQPAVSSRIVQVVSETFTENWSSQNAYSDMKRLLKAHPAIEGVVAANDSTANGVIQALSEVGLAGKIPVSGQDAELGACRRILEGTQTVTVYKPLADLGRTAVELAVALARGESVAVNGTTFNGSIDVPSILLESVAVTRENMRETVIRDGFHSADDLFGTMERTQE